MKKNIIMFILCLLVGFFGTTLFICNSEEIVLSSKIFFSGIVLVIILKAIDFFKGI